MEEGSAATALDSSVVDLVAFLVFSQTNSQTNSHTKGIRHKRPLQEVEKREEMTRHQKIDCSFCYWVPPKEFDEWYVDEIRP